MLPQALAAAAGKPLVVVLIHGGPLDVSDMLAAPGVGAILSAWVPGQHGALGIADLLLGRAVPSGAWGCVWVKGITAGMQDLRRAGRLTHYGCQGYRREVQTVMRPGLPPGL